MKYDLPTFISNIKWQLSKRKMAWAYTVGIIPGVLIGKLLIVFNNYGAEKGHINAAECFHRYRMELSTHIIPDIIAIIVIRWILYFAMRHKNYPVPAEYQRIGRNGKPVWS